MEYLPASGWESSAVWIGAHRDADHVSYWHLTGVDYVTSSGVHVPFPLDKMNYTNFDSENWQNENDQAVAYLAMNPFTGKWADRPLWPRSARVPAYMCEDRGDSSAPQLYRRVHDSPIIFGSKILNRTLLSGDAELLITGENFLSHASSELNVSVGGQSCSPITLASDTVIRCVIGSRASPGPSTVSLHTSLGAAGYGSVASIF